MACLLGMDGLTSTTTTPATPDLYQIVRRNAFASDVPTLDSIEHHSCVPNAVRVFAGDTMMVHASSCIKAGQEIRWSYVPPTLAFPVRDKRLRTQFGFKCTCERCVLERSAWHGNVCRTLVRDVYEQVAPFNTQMTGPADLDYQQLRGAVSLLRDKLGSCKALSNALKHHLCVGYTHVYMNYLHAALATDAGMGDDPILHRQGLLTIATELHVALSACHNASTEHLSLLHLCCELVASMHSHTAVDQTPTQKKLRFWTAQSKRIHMVRYGSLGQDLESLRNVMTHTQTVLRHRDGIERVPYPFL